MPTRKLDKALKDRLRACLKDIQTAEFMALCADAETTLQACALRRLHAVWDQSGVQADMAVLAHHDTARRVEGVNLQVHNPETDRHDIGFGVRVTTELMVPARPEIGPYPEIEVPADDPDHARLLAFDRYRNTHEETHARERADLEAAFRKTGSLARLHELAPRAQTLIPLALGRSTEASPS